MRFFITDDDMCTTQMLNLARVQKWIEANGNTVVEDVEDADKILCMTCNGWSLLEELSYNRIKSYSKDHADKMIVVGCLNDAHPDQVKEIWTGPTVKTAGNKPYSFAGIEDFFPDFTVKLEDIPAQSVFRRKEDYRDYNLSKRFVNINEGCAFDCTFCTHKPGLGERRSRPVDGILGQIKECVEEGVRIVSLMGMETSLYGPDVGSNYPELLKAVLDYNDSYEVHVAQFQPDGINRYYDKLLSLFQNKRVTDIQIPIQSTSPRLMKMMNRQEHSHKIGPFMKSVREFNTRAILRTDIIIGWPTETEEERIATLDFAGNIFDEIALYTIELSPARPAWKFQKDAFSEEELAKIRQSSIDYINSKYSNVVVHSGQQDDNTMKAAEKKRMELRKSREALV
jgi:tRNA A37 methylthiotransferase MiaB